MHVGRLRNIRSMLNNKAPQTYAHLNTQNKVKTKQLFVKNLET